MHRANRRINNLELAVCSSNRFAVGALYADRDARYREVLIVQHDTRDGGVGRGALCQRGRDEARRRARADECGGNAMDVEPDVRTKGELD